MAIPGFPVNRPIDTPSVALTLSGVATSTGYTPTNGVLVPSAQPSLIGPFTPDLVRSVFAEIVGTGATGVITVLRSRNGGATMLSMTAGGVPWAIYTFNNVTGVIVNETVDAPESSILTYYLSINLSAGSVTYALYQ